MGFGSFEERVARLKRTNKEIDSDGVHRSEGDFGSRSETKVSSARWTRRVHRAGVTAYLLYNGSATYVMLRA